MKLRLATACALSLGFLCAEVPAQSVYVTRGENGPVFSDKPQAGAKELTLKPLTVIPAPQGNVPANKAGSPSGGPDARQAERKPPEASAPYRSLTVVEPADGGSVAGDTSLLEVRLAVDPPLLLAEGHAFIVRIDGQPVDQRFTATEFVIPPAFWPEGFLPANRGVQLEVAVIDGNGQVVMRAAPVRFHSRPIVILPPPYATPYPAPYPPPSWNRPRPPSVERPAVPPKKPGRNATRGEAPFRKD